MGLFGRLFAAGYDRMMAGVDREGAAERRRALVGDLEGDVLEVGAGTGLNFPYYRTARRVVALEPDAGMRARAEERARAADVPVEVVDGDAMRLPFDDGAFDAVVFSLVLCTVPDEGAALAEARRVLRPGGTLCFFEHVRAEDPRLARWQDRIERPWSWFARGCHPNRDAVAAVRASGFEDVTVERFGLPVPALVRPAVVGSARKGTSGG